MATAKNKPLRDLPAIMGGLSKASAFLETAVRSLEGWHDPAAQYDEVTCLRHGLSLLSAAYNDLDRFERSES